MSDIRNKKYSWPPREKICPNCNGVFDSEQMKFDADAYYRHEQVCKYGLLDKLIVEFFKDADEAKEDEEDEWLFSQDENDEPVTDTSSWYCCRENLLGRSCNCT